MPSYDWQSASEGKTYNFSTTLLEKGIIQNMLVEKNKKNIYYRVHLKYNSVG